MSENMKTVLLDCTKCIGKLTPRKEVIKAITQGGNYKIIRARLHVCDYCGHNVYIKMEDEE